MEKSEFTRQVLAAEPLLYHLSKTILKNDEDCADAVQEALCTAFAKLHTLRDARYFRTWLCRILLNECYRICRSRKKLVPLEDYMLPQLPSGFQEKQALFAAVMGLRMELRLVVVLHYVEGFPLWEISETLKIPMGTVKSRLYRARAELRSALQEEEALCHE